jgi:hypothetical protein
MKKKLLFITLFGLLVAPVVLAKNFTAQLQGSQEVPPVETAVTGSLNLTLNNDLTQGTFILDVLNGKGITAAHLHCAPPGQNGPIVVGLFSASTSTGSDVTGRLPQGFFTTNDIQQTARTCQNPISDLVQLQNAIEQGNIYVNVHSTSSPNGFIRGQVVSTSSSSPSVTPPPTGGTGGTTVGSRFTGQPDPYIILSSYYRLPNQTFTVSGRGFGVNEDVHVSFAGQTVAVTANNVGEFTAANISVPFSVINSNQTVTAHGVTSGLHKSATLVVGTFYPFVSPSAYFFLPGQNISFNGIRFAPGEQVAMRRGGENIGTFTADGSGSFSTGSALVPSFPGNYTYTFTGSLTGLVSTVNIIVGQPW